MFSLIKKLFIVLSFSESLARKAKSLTEQNVYF